MALTKEQKAAQIEEIATLLKESKSFVIVSYKGISVADDTALRVKFRQAGVTYKQGGLWWEENAPEIDKAVAAAQGVDVIVACIGENSYCETPGNLTDLNMSENQRNLVKALAKTASPSSSSSTKAVRASWPTSSRWPRRWSTRCCRATTAVMPWPD